MYETILLVIFLLISLAIIGLVLVQHGKGADMGASFGAGASATLFGSSGTGNFLTRTTTVLGVIFFALSLLLANLSSHSASVPSKNDEFSDLGQGMRIEQTVPASTEQPTTVVPSRSDATSEIPE